MALAQSSLPPTSPTASLVPTASANPIATPRPAHAAQVSYQDGRLEIVADGSSLNQILREIGRVTAMKITGGVVDQRVYGKYGPGAPAEILGNLLDGTDCNMLLLETSSAAPAELILTPRNGAVSPPNPNAPGFEDDTSSRDEDPRPAPNAQSARSPLQSRRPYVAPPATVANPVLADTPAVAAPSASSDSTPANAPAATPDSAIPTSPNGVQTPEQIYQQLQQLQKAQPHP